MGRHTIILILFIFSVSLLRAQNDWVSLSLGTQHGGAGAEAQSATSQADTLRYTWHYRDWTQGPAVCTPHYLFITKGILEQLCEFSNDRRIRHVRINLHTDTKGTNKYNLKLARQQASEVEACLRKHSCWDGDRITVHAKGESEPIFAEKDMKGLGPEGVQDAQTVNRRVEVELIAVPE